MKNLITNFFTAIFLILINFFQAEAQDSLYLNYTITGDTLHPLEFSKGIGDVNGDGYTDLMVSFSRTQETRNTFSHLYLGGDPFDTIPDFTFQSSFFLELGDINNDGFDDFIFAKNHGPGVIVDVLELKLALGGTNIDTLTKFSFFPKYLDEVFSNKIEPIGDLNNDGFNDIAIGAPYNWANGIGHVYLFWGGDTISNEPDLVLENTLSGDQFGTSICGIGDINNDGVDDLAVGAPEEAFPNDTLSYVYIFYGGNDMDAEIDTLLNSKYRYEYFGSYIQNAGDINGDSIRDIIINSNGFTYIYSTLSLISKIDSHNEITGAGGDINYDGFADFLIGFENFTNTQGIMVGKAELYYGSNVLDTLPDFSFEGENKWGQFARRMNIVGDLNNNNFDEFIIVAPKYPRYDKPEGKLYIYSYTNVSSLNPINPKTLNNFILKQNCPNPFNATTVIEYYTPITTNVELSIFDLLGKELYQKIKQKQNSGNHTFILNAKDWASGIYFYQLKTNTFIQTKKMLLIK